MYSQVLIWFQCCNGNQFIAIDALVIFVTQQEQISRDRSLTNNVEKRYLHNDIKLIQKGLRIAEIIFLFIIANTRMRAHRNACGKPFSPIIHSFSQTGIHTYRYTYRCIFSNAHGILDFHMH